ncbi:zinc finger protein 346 isoform X9 [Crocuta crocuta]
MEYPALGTVEAADSGGARPYNSSEEREGREPDGLRFDRERARRLWEAVSGAQPVGREEEQKTCQQSEEIPSNPWNGDIKGGNEEARLRSALSKRLTNPFLVASTLALHQNREMIDPDKFCSLCHATFNDPVMAQQHYVGKKHRKQETKLKLMAHYGRLADPAVTDSSAGKGYPCKTCKIVLNSIEQYQAHVSGFKHKNHSSSELRHTHHFMTAGNLMSGRLSDLPEPLSYLELDPEFKPFDSKVHLFCSAIPYGAHYPHLMG